MSTAAGTPQHLTLDPVARVVGPLSFETFLDVDRGEVVSAAARAMVFRGYELILERRDVRDAIYLASRACGACGGAHATAAALACEMAMGIAPPPMGIAVRNLLSALEHLHELPLALFTRSGPDYSASVVRATSPRIWEQAEKTPAPGRGVHKLERIADVMDALDHVSGQLYTQALAMSRTALEAYVLFGGKYPHPQTIVPGGVSTTVDSQTLNMALLRVSRFPDYARRAVAVWDDIVEFFYEVEPRYRRLGALPANLVSLGLWDDPLSYDASYEQSPSWGERRWATPGAIVNGRLVSTSLTEIDAHVEEFVEHSFYADWRDRAAGDGRHGTSRTGSAHHPASKRTIPQPGETSSRGDYSWATAPRWNGTVMDTGAYAHLWTTALAGAAAHERFVESTGHSLRMAMPQAVLPAGELEWHPPEQWGTLERNRARAYALAFATMVAYEQVLAALDFARTGETRISTPFEVPHDACSGTGFWGSARGFLSHHLSIDRGVIGNYQILSPSTWTLSPRDGQGRPGACEQAVAATPLIAEGGEYIDILRTIRSFDPCASCATH